METPTAPAVELPDELYHDKEEFADWGWIRAAGSPALVAVVKWPGPPEEECQRHRAAGTDPHQPMVDRIIQCYNSCAGIADPTKTIPLALAHYFSWLADSSLEKWFPFTEEELASLNRQLEAWETSAKLRDDGLCPTQREVIADQQAQIEALEVLRGEFVSTLKAIRPWMISAIMAGVDDLPGFDPSQHVEVKIVDAAIAKAEGKGGEPV